MKTRRSLGGVALLFFLNGVLLGSWLPRLPEIRDRVGLSLADLGVTLAVGGVGGLFGSAVSGRFIGRFGARRSAVDTAFLALVLLPLIAFAPSPALLAASVFAIALADAVADVGMNALAVRLEEVRTRSIFTRLHGLWSIGNLVGAAVSTAAVALGVSLGAQLLGTALVGVGILYWADRLLPATEIRPRARPHRGMAVALALAGGAAALLEGTPGDWSAIYLTDVLDTSAAVAGAGFLCLTVGMLAGRLGGDALVDRTGAVRSLLAGLAVVAVAVGLTVTAAGVPLVLIALALWGLGVSVTLPLLYRLAGSHPGFGEGGGLAALTLGSRVGFLAGPAAVGGMADLAGLPVGITVVVGVGLLVSAVIIGRTLRD
jgi:predicted MFS family arabinose efflux permease